MDRTDLPPKLSVGDDYREVSACAWTFTKGHHEERVLSSITQASE
jgi:hypothetical protein